MLRTDWLARQAAYHPDRPALVCAASGTSYSFATLNALGNALAAHLTGTYGLTEGDRVAVLAENTPEHVLLFVAAQKAGLVLVPLNWRLTAAELAYIVGDSAPKLAFVAAGYGDRTEPWAASVRREPLAALCDWLKTAPTEATWSERRFAPDTPLMLLYTSGTTGRPKGAIVSHGMLFYNAVNTAQRLDLTSHDVSFNAAPFYHTGGWNVLLTPFLLWGGTTHLLDGFDPEALLRLCDRECMTILWGVPTMLKLMSDHPAFHDVTLDSVRYAVVGGEAMPEPLIRVWQEKGVPVRQGFGMTEVGVNCFSLPEREAAHKIGSIGLPNFLIDTRVIDDAGADIAPGETGELLMRGPVVTPGYWRNPEATAAAIRDGWFHTGDLVRQDEDGYFYVVGRKKEMYISGGENVYPAEVEAALYALEGVAEAAVVGVTDARWGEAGVAFVVVKAGADLDEVDVLAWCRRCLAPYKVPRAVRFVPALPKGHSGKVLKSELQRRLNGPA